MGEVPRLSRKYFGKVQDVLVVSLAGHGTMVGQRYYFIPQEMKCRPGRTLEQDVRTFGIPGDNLAEWLSMVPALKRVLILDTCQSGGAVGLTKTKRNPFAFRGAIERLNRASGVFTIAAAATGEEAGEVKELKHGVLTYTLLAGLRAVERGPLSGRSLRAANDEEIADVLQWFGFASGEVPRLTKKYFGRSQNIETSSQGASFPILPLRDR